MVKLTSSEKKWLQELQDHLDNAPVSLRKKGRLDKIRSFTIGDPDVTVYDGEKFDEYVEGRSNNHIKDVCVDVNNSNSELFHLRFPFCVESTAG